MILNKCFLNMNYFLYFILLSKLFYITHGSSVRNVRLVDHTSYALKIVRETVKRLEDQQWSSLKMEDMTISINQTIFGRSIKGDVEFVNGFVLSIQSVDIVQSTVQQVWLPTRVNTTNVEVRASLRMLDVAIGYDVLSKTNIGNYRSTVVINYPEIQFRFTVDKNLFTDEITASVVGVLMRAHNRIEFVPEDEMTKIISVLYQWNLASDSVSKLGSDVLTPITSQLVGEVDFPTICYNCPVT